jgi:lipoprotein-releasing system ATP-binding protein
MSKPEDVLHLKEVSRSFQQGSTEISVLKGVELSISRGEVLGLVGPSGSGKSTLLQIAGILERPNSGKVIIGGISCWDENDNVRAELRQRNLGFVFQYHHLLSEFSALENVMLPQMAAGKSKQEASKRAEQLLSEVGLGGRLYHLPGELSGGEQQRVAICRGLANEPKLLLADEPTGNLDEKTAFEISGMLRARASKTGVALVIATHNSGLTEEMDRVVRVQDGFLV